MNANFLILIIHYTWATCKLGEAGEGYMSILWIMSLCNYSASLTLFPKNKLSFIGQLTVDEQSPTGKQNVKFLFL